MRLRTKAKLNSAISESAKQSERASIGLSKVDNTSDVEKAVSIPVQQEIDALRVSLGELETEVASIVSISDGDKGDVTVSGSGTAWSVDRAADFSKLPQAAGSGYFVARYTGGSGDFESLPSSLAVSLLDVVSTGNRGVAPASPGGTTTFLRADGTWATPSGAVSWGGVGGTLSNQTDLQTALDGKVDENGAITGATKTKVTYDAKGLVTAGADATTADIADSSNKRYVTDAQQTVISNTSGTNTGDNATNTQYSGLAASKQDTLVSGTNIKTINSTTLLGSGDITTATVSDAAYGAGWDGDTTTAPSKNAVYDKIQTMSGGVSMGDVYPVGSVYISVVATNPATLLGVGTWSSFGAGRVLVGINAGDADFDTVEETGGSKTVASAGSVAAPTISGSTAAEAAHTHSVTSNVTVADHSSHTHTYTDVVNHTHTVNITDPGHVHAISMGTTDGAVGRVDSSSSAQVTTFNTNSATTGITAATVNPAGGVATGTTAGPSATLTHTPTNNAVTSGAGSSHSHGTGTLAASSPAFTGSATSVVQPYIVVYMWKRTA